MKLNNNFSDFIGRAYDIENGKMASSSSVLLAKEALFDFSQEPTTKVTIGNKSYQLPHVFNWNSGTSSSGTTTIEGSSEVSYLKSISNLFSTQYSGVIFKGSISSTFKSVESNNNNNYFITETRNRSLGTLSFNGDFKDYLSAKARDFINDNDISPVDVFAKYGIYFIKSFEVGGRLSVDAASEQSQYTKQTEFNLEVKAAYKALETENNTEIQKTIKKLASNSSYSFYAEGGDLDIISSQSPSSDEFQLWLKSIASSPTLTWFNNLDDALVPIWTLAKNDKRQAQLKSYYQNKITGGYLRSMYFIAHTRKEGDGYSDPDTNTPSKNVYITCKNYGQKDAASHEFILDQNHMLAGAYNSREVNGTDVYDFSEAIQSLGSKLDSRYLDVTLTCKGEDAWAPDILFMIGEDEGKDFHVLAADTDQTKYLSIEGKDSVETVTISSTITNGAITSGSTDLNGFWLITSTDKDEYSHTDSNDVSVTIELKNKKFPISQNIDIVKRKDRRSNIFDLSASINNNSENIIFEDIKKISIINSSGDDWKLKSAICITRDFSGHFRVLAAHPDLGDNFWIGKDYKKTKEIFPTPDIE
ncbi:MAC/perforin domain-containing protein [Marinomonas sp. MED121]|uniref:MAC/perforin domain-containing protein n=1 Tax=Marinomonas sp. MED121 TaxID=314277 RepID=UPI0002E490D1|nr:MAC/perforin domain-containing protein [Marinomonas sp. MED121]